MDEDLRELERAAARGEPGARRALLVARRRGGLLDEERLAHAAALGDEDARALLGPDAPDERGLVEWLYAVEAAPWGQVAGLVAAVAAARSVLPLFEARCPEDPGPRRCIEASERVLECPSDEHRAQARALAEALGRAWLDHSRRAPPRGPSPDHVTAAQAALFTAGAAARPAQDTRLYSLATAQAITEARKVARRAVEVAARTALCRWLLGA